MDLEASALLERILLDESEDPTSFPIGLLKSITNDFSNDQKIGSGGFADVYKGQLQSGKVVAVKKLKQQSEMVDKKFIQEVKSMMKVKHKNVVRFLGYCSDTQGKMWKHEGEDIMADERERFLCFEFLPQGSLDKHISDASSGLEWRTRYHIIKGICEGLLYLHGEKIVHSDLKPENILLDHKMVPKIGDFGLARSIPEEQTRAITKNVFGTRYYMAPEYFCDGVITFKSDIYSLGTIITEILTGQKKDLLVENVYENWTTRFRTSHGGTWLEHVKVCAEIGLECRYLDPKNRPTIRQIIDRLAELEHKYGFIETELLKTHVEALSPSRNSVNNSQGSSHKISVHLFFHSSGLVAARFPYNQLLVDAFRKTPKASWNVNERVWMFPLSSLAIVEDFHRSVPGLAVEVHKLDPLVLHILDAASKSKDLQGLYEKIPAKLESQLRPFQREGIRFVLQHGGRALIADETGLGKTVQAIAVASCLRDSWPVLVISPSSLLLHWATAIQSWLNIPMKDILVVLPRTGGSHKAGFRVVYSNTKGEFHLDGVFNVISYDVVHDMQSTLLGSDFKIVIADESHCITNSRAKRTVASLPVLQKAQYAVLLSGTPALSRPIKLFTQIQALYPEVYENVSEYSNRYCKGDFLELYQGASNLEELHNLMKSTVMIRRLKKDVLAQLHVKRTQQVFLNISEEDVKNVHALFIKLHTLKIKIKSSDSKEKIESLRSTCQKTVSQIYIDSAKAKIPAVLDFVGTKIKEGCKFLIFAHHQTMIDAIEKHLWEKNVKCIRIDGMTPLTTRQTLVTAFQENDDVKAAVLSIKAGGYRITSTAVSTVIFSELSWTPRDIIQAEDRAHIRIDQVSSVNVYYLLSHGTADDLMWGAVRGELENLGQVLDGQQKTLHGLGPNPSKQQKTLDGFLKRPSTSTSTEEGMPSPSTKQPRRI